MIRVHLNFDKAVEIKDGAEFQILDGTGMLVILNTDGHVIGAFSKDSWDGVFKDTKVVWSTI